MSYITIAGTDGDDWHLGFVLRQPATGRVLARWTDCVGDTKIHHSPYQPPHQLTLCYQLPDGKRLIEMRLK